MCDPVNMGHLFAMLHFIVSVDTMFTNGMFVATLLPEHLMMQSSCPYLLISHLLLLFLTDYTHTHTHKTAPSKTINRQTAFPSEVSAGNYRDAGQVSIWLQTTLSHQRPVSARGDFKWSPVLTHSCEFPRAPKNPIQSTCVCLLHETAKPG